MNSLILIAALAPVPSDGEVSLADARAFGMSGQTARYLWQVTTRHQEIMWPKLYGWNSEETIAQWDRECQWRSRCYFLLDDVLYCNYSPSAKLRSLRALKELIGDEAYYAGVMPLPTPQYRPWTQ